MNKLTWFEKTLNPVDVAGMLPFYLERISGTLVRLEHKVRNISEELLSTEFEGKWSVKQNIGHLGDVESVGIKRLDEIAGGISPMSPAVMVPLQDYNNMPIRQVLDYFFQLRHRTLEKYLSIPEKDLSKSSLHPRLKIMMSPVGLAYFHAEHDDHHLVRISEILNTLNH